ncbi:unknown [[Mannheimia] succiniciproducens MBEL55E]|uniref:Uncharacterized protein n=1 Tax=Mannheimia succiniciproducens (strain KCTC 0769BP / MBEL55E) TaxID=221988 RepID=Q65SE0_MANSM|nr:unknown [[Mannheimia] succiniciproducens MBEL55E]
MMGSYYTNIYLPCNPKMKKTDFLPKKYQILLFWQTNMPPIIFGHHPI